ncbi:MAG: peptidylprolyl isomerase [Rhodobacter sp.]|nr:peptidylprolyl isomerase [Rhodobacter sp.]MCY4169346.1 peptidylprolyl isomerase [Rhodobacter sp.]MCY4242612.1 peptidylprolyl isomerase [Rhodobacter sp.]
MLRQGTLLLAGAFGLATAVHAAAQDITADTVVATVGETDITIGHMIAMSLGLNEEQRQMPPGIIFDGVLESLIQQEAVGQARSRLSRYGELHLENERRSLLAGEAVGELAETITVSPDEIEDAYETRYAGYVPSREFNAAHILLESRDDATEIVGELRGGADFAELAKARSIGPSGPNGGNLGWFGPGQMVPEFENAVAALQEGQVSDPVQTQFGWHVIILNDIRETPVPTLDDAREQLRQEIWQRKLANDVQAIVDAANKNIRDLADIDPDILNDGSLIER